ncbi:TonB family C-terminal domain-containing protein [Maribacter sedimenticola]|uniref:TonB family C-terminal domain-containing protein n=1 Tax=Maribacter sedimenticola TaxID=228956 RepID=A0ABY1SD86_9FLAO|nr:M56 family metallopeptidase [Maribacter sedimenticola]SNR28017.1 TonB family C-terminal domain-containing protein [Maribacter sedimenticola]
MLQFVLECIAFQLLFLVIYDFFLKRETFFQWNRVYLLATFILSLVLPWVKIEAFKQQMPQNLVMYPELWWNFQKPEITATAIDEPFFNITWQEGLLYGGMLVAFVLFLLKLGQLHLLKKHGKKIKYPEFTQIIISNSTMAFSFFKSIFLGDKVVAKKHDTIIAHELVHIRQGHTWDLLFFEIMRIIAWFNPLVYVYQNRTAELHEFIADAQVSKEQQPAHYQQLLAQVFETEHISFINQFFTKSLIKKRIVMLQKSKSKKVWQLKYLLLVPMVMGMLFYTSCELDATLSEKNDITLNDQELIDKVSSELTNLSIESSNVFSSGLMQKYYEEDEILTKEEFFKVNLFINKMLTESNLQTQENSSTAVDMGLGNPTTEKYLVYVAKIKAFKLLDPNLKASVSAFKKNIRLISKEDKNLGPGEFITVRNVSKLTSVELMKINGMLESLEEASQKNLSIFLQDNTYIFQIFKKTYVVDFNVLVEDVELVENKEVPFAIADQVPIFPGCENASDKRSCFNDKIQLHISKNFRYPIEAQEAGLQGRVSVMFMITKEGAIENIRLRGPDKLLEDEVERIIKRLPNMTPGKHQGNAVNVPFSIPVTFKLK